MVKGRIFDQNNPCQNAPNQTCRQTPLSFHLTEALYSRVCPSELNETYFWVYLGIPNRSVLITKYYLWLPLQKAGGREALKGIILYFSVAYPEKKEEEDFGYKFKLTFKEIVRIHCICNTNPTQVTSIQKFKKGKLKLMSTDFPPISDFKTVSQGFNLGF